MTLKKRSTVIIYTKTWTVDQGMVRLIHNQNQSEILFAVMAQFLNEAQFWENYAQQESP